MNLEAAAKPKLTKLLSTATSIFNSNFTLVIFYILFSLSIFAESMSNPSYNWDMIGYVGSVRYFQIKDKVELHKSVYGELYTTVNENKYNELTTSYYRETTSKDPEAFYQQLPFYQIKVLYVFLVMLLNKLGISIFTATYLISALGSILGIWVLLFSFKSHLGKCFLYLIPIFGLVFEISRIARTSTPDGLAFLVVSLITYFLMTGNRIIFLILPLSILIRTDLIIFVLMVNIYLFLYQKSLRYLALINVLICVLVFYAVNEYFGYYGWSILFYHSFSEWLAYPADIKIDITPALYIKALYAGLRSLSANNSFFAYIVIALLSVMVFFRHYNRECLQNIILHRIFFLFMASSIYVAAHFVLFPEIKSRFFLGEYMLTAIGFMYLMSYIGPSNKLALKQ